MSNVPNQAWKNFRSAALFCALAAGLAAPLSAAANLDTLNVYPNPVRRYQGANQVTFDNLTPQVRIRIYNAAGTLVREVQQTLGGNSYQWDLKNASGRDVASGVYVYLLTNDAGEKKSGKIAVIR